MKWHVGQKVRCIITPNGADQRHSQAGLWEKGCTVEPQIGVIYTITKIWLWYDGCTFWLHELDDPWVSFHEELFEPLPEISTEIDAKHETVT